MSRKPKSPSAERSAVAAALRTAVTSWIADGEARDAITINNGLCADFADATSREIREKLGIVTSILSFHDFCLDVPTGQRSIGLFDAAAIGLHSKFVPPPGCDWGLLETVGANAEISHSWIFHEGLHYDAETPEGTANPFDLSCIRHALAELMERGSPDTYNSLVAEHDWWARTRDIRTLREVAMQADEPTPCP